MKKLSLLISTMCIFLFSVNTQAHTTLFQNTKDKHTCPTDVITRGLYHDDAPTMQMVLNYCHIPSELLNKQCRGDICNPLVQAVMQDRLDTAKLLVEAGADININSGASSGDTPLIFAILNDNYAMVEYLTSQGADVNLKNNSGISPWWGAVAFNDSKLIELFLQNGADVNATGGHPDMLDTNNEVVAGVTPLMIAVKNNNINLVKQLIDKQADMNMTDFYGRKAIDYAKTEEIKQLLIK